MNRLLRLLSFGGLLATSSLTSLTACAEGPPPQGAVAPTTQATPAQAPAPAAAPSDAPAAEAPAAPAPGEAAAAPATAEPPNPSEYDVATDTDPAALTDFRDTLEPYGTWEDDATYGTVWVPASTVVGVEFTPYVTHGHWALTASNSWLWVSDFNWGWAPFHYGRWVWIGGRGWAWIPGRVYSPAWVVWRTGYYDDWYVGWAPMPPVWYWRSGFAVSLWYVPPAPYVFCSSRYVFSPRVRGYIVPSERVGYIAPRTRPYIAATAGVASSSYRMPSASRGPTMNDAHVPADAVPATRASHDARAISFAQSTGTARSLRSRPFDGNTGPAPSSALRPSSFPAERRPFTGSSPLPPTTQRPLGPSTAPEPIAPRSFSPPPAPAPRPFTPPPPAPIAPRTFTPPPAPAPHPVFTPPSSPAPIAPRSFSPPAPAPRFSPPAPAPIAPRSFSPPAPVAPRVAPAVRSMPSPPSARSFGGRR